jgi:hypothetical protein
MTETASQTVDVRIEVAAELPVELLAQLKSRELELGDLMNIELWPWVKEEYGLLSLLVFYDSPTLTD